MNRLKSELLARAAWDGFRVRHRVAGVKFDEKNATLLPDMQADPATGLQVGDTVTVSADTLVSGCLQNFQLVGGSDERYYSKQIFRILGFVEIGAKIGRCNTKFVYVALATRDAEFKKPNVCVDLYGSIASFPVCLYWVGSLRK
ncbi:hypothetical protein HY416_04335 [Candidatus Kaiserbacteria bacterium]|nr:hypothetical protein [Candidatus Kaiserbacteria bacterium]